MNIALYFENIISYILGWPLIIYVISISAICTTALYFIQFRYFIKSWKLTLFPETPKIETQEKFDMTPFQAFVNTLSTSLGNGSIAGMATAIYSGGPGAAFWVLVVGIITMALRFSEIFLSTYFRNKTKEKSSIGGPMLYLKSVIGGKTLSWIYALFTLCYGLIVGCAMQANSVRISAETTWGLKPITVAIALLLFVLYVIVGGAPRIVKISNKIVPLKVGLFFSSTLFILIYHFKSIIPALKIIINSAFSPTAMAGGAIGFSVQQAIRFGMIRNINATESGLGTAAIFFSSTGSKKPVETGIMSMLITFISTIVCFLICLCIVASGVWDSGLTSTALTISAYQTVFGSFAGLIVSFLSITFGLGVVVAFVYVSKECWMFLTKRKFGYIFDTLFCLFTFAGALMKVDIVWSAGDIINASMLAINLFGILYLLPLIRKKVLAYIKDN